MDRVSSSECSQGEDRAAYRTTFEQSYTQYEFAELVRLALAIGAWLVNMRRRAEKRGPDVPRRRSPGEMNPAK